MATGLNTFKGTTEQVHAALKSTPPLIGDNTVVTITDRAYDLVESAVDAKDGLLDIIKAAAPNKVILEMSDKALVGSAADLKIMLAGVSSYTGDLTVDSASEVSATDLNTIAKGTTGKVKATLDVTTPLTKATVDALADVKATDVITFAPTAKTADAAILVAINKIISNANFTAVATITAAAADVALVKEALAYSTVGEPAVTITGAISAADVNAIANATNGVVTATIADGTVAATLKAIKNVDGGDVITFKTTDTTVKATELKALKDLVDNLDASSVKTITAAAADVVTAAADVAAAAAVAPTANVTITGSISAANASSIAKETTGVLTATITEATAADLLSNLGDTNTSDILALTVNDTALVATSTTALVSLLEKTGGKIKVNSTTVGGTIEDLTSIYVTNKAKFEGLGNEAVTISGGEVSAAQLNAIAAATSGKVTATLSSDTPLNAATVTALKDVKTTDDITFESSAEVLNSVEAFNALLAINKIISGADFDSVTTIEADAKDIALVKEVLKYVPITVAVTINGEISAADANIIAKSGNGALTATIKAGSVAATLKAIEDVDGGDVITFKTTDKSADASELVALAGKVDDFDASSVKTITAKSTTDVTAALAIAEDAAVTITGNVAVADIKAILAATTGKVTATLAAGSATVLATALDDNEVNAINVTVNDAAAAAADDLLDIKDSTSGKITVSAKEVSGSFDDLKELYVTSKGKFTALGDENVTISGTVSAADANIIAKAVNGVVTANVEAAEASELISQLKDAKSTDRLSLTVSGESVKASELNVLDGKTSGTVTVDGDVVISGNIADLTKVFATGSGITTDNNAVTILGTVSAKDANAIVTKTTGEVTATIAADTAAKLKAALSDSDNVLNLTVNGTKADAVDLAKLLDKTAGKITVTAKEISGSLAEIKAVLVTNADKFTGLDKVAVKITGTVASADLADLDAILAATSGIVTATVAAGKAGDLVAALENAKANDALKLEVAVTDTPNAADLLALDGKTSVVVDVKATSITGTAADVKKLLASKGVSLLKNVNITLDADTEVSAADVNAIAKATGGKVTATVAAGTAAALNKALGNATKNDAITLEVSGKTATAADLLALDDKTNIAVNANEVESITGTVADLKKVFTAAQLATPTIELADEVAVSVSGTVKASDLKDVLTAADGIVTATVAAGKAADLATNLADNPENALKVTITDTKVDAKDLLLLDAATSIAVNAASVKTITGDAKKVLDAYEAGADKGISGLGNEDVDLTGATDANAELVSAINDFTTGLIKLPTIKFADEATTFSLSDLGDLKGITGLVEINAENGGTDVKDIINISLKDLLEANDSKTDFTLNITTATGATLDVVNLTNDVSGWTGVAGTGADANKLYTYTNDKTHQVVTITANEAIIA